MKSNFKKIIIIVVIIVILALLFIFISKKSPDAIPNLSSSTEDTSTNSQDAGAAADDFLTWLLSVKSINLDTSVFSDPAFVSLNDSSILLTPDGTEGRPNPFAPIGVDVSLVVPSGTSSTTTTLSNTQEKNGGDLPVKSVNTKNTN